MLFSKKRNLPFLLLLFVLQLAKAQNPQKALGLEIESDPIAFIFKGYSLHLAYTFQDVRASMGVFGIETPGMFLDNKAFSVFTSGYDVKLDYLFGSKKGLFMGSQLTYGKDNIELKESRKSQNLWGYSVGLRSGYRFMFGKKESNYKGIYIVPWIALIHSIKAQEIQLGPETYSQPSWTIFPTVHLGWRF
ncbi:hypothetical protein ACFSKL_16070 [Belliella marina]|uniref:DUF3575 domain-containing protein n=1 Tax=Belliella marina TaxID=1644146 RepID=A0ABW4VQB1_9BACT